MSKFNGIFHNQVILYKVSNGKNITISPSEYISSQIALFRLQILNICHCGETGSSCG